MSRRLNEQEFRAMMQKAADTNAERDAMDVAHGICPPMEASIVVALETIDSAIMAGIMLQDWDCVCEGLEMLRTLTAGEKVRS